MDCKSDVILDTVVSFLDTAPELEGSDIEYGSRVTGEFPWARMQTVFIDGQQYLFQATKVGGFDLVNHIKSSAE